MHNQGYAVYTWIYMYSTLVVIIIFPLFLFSFFIFFFLSQVWLLCWRFNLCCRDSR